MSQSTRISLRPTDEGIMQQNIGGVFKTPNLPNPLLTSHTVSHSPFFASCHQATTTGLPPTIGKSDVPVPLILSPRTPHSKYWSCQA